MTGSCIGPISPVMKRSHWMNLVIDSRVSILSLSSGLCFSVMTFFRRIYDPEVGSGAVDVYAMMFSCQFIIFIIIVFSWSAFSSPEVSKHW